jgi:hypothetical protein
MGGRNQAYYLSESRNGIFYRDYQAYAEEFKIQIIDLTGRIVKDADLEANKSVSISGLAPGSYIIKTISATFISGKTLIILPGN